MTDLNNNSIVNIEFYEALTDINKLTKFLKDKTNIENIFFDGDNIIMWCAAYGNSETFDYLIKNGCSIYYKNNRGYTPLHESCAFGKTSIIHYILHNDINLIKSVSSNGRTILHELFKYNQYDALSYLISYYPKHLNSLKIKDNYGKFPEEYTSDNNMQYLNMMIN
jgi:ankyrin repeat protein